MDEIARKLGFTLRYTGGQTAPWIMQWLPPGKGARPATDQEVKMWQMLKSMFRYRDTTEGIRRASSTSNDVGPMAPDGSTTSSHRGPAN